MPAGAKSIGGETWRNLRYGAAAFALGMPTIPLLVHLPAIYAAELGIGLTATGVALFIARIFDVVSDPLIGVASDRLDTRWGRRKPIILAGGFIGALGTVLLLNPGSGIGAAYLAIWASVLYLGWTMINIPYLAWGAALSPDYFGRTRITSIREGFMLGGIVAAGAIPAVAAALGFGERQALALIGWGVVGVGAILFAVLLIGVDEPPPPPSHRTEPPWPALKGVFANKPFRLLVGGWFVNSLANGIPAALFILFMTFVLEADELQRGILTFVYFVAGVVGIPFWLWLSGRIGKHITWCVSMGIACIAFAFVPFLGAGDIIAFFVITLVTGMTLGADLAIPPSMQADVAEYEILRSRRDRTGLLFSIWSMTTKFAVAFSVLIALPTLEVLGFRTEADGGPQNLLALSVIYAGVPVVLKITSIAIIWHHPLTAEKQRVVMRRLSVLEARRTKLVGS